MISLQSALLLKCIISKPVLQTLLPPPVVQNYSLRHSKHYRWLYECMLHLTDCNFIFSVFSKLCSVSLYIRETCDLIFYFFQLCLKFTSCSTFVGYVSLPYIRQLIVQFTFFKCVTGGRMNTVFSESDPSCFANLGAQYISPSVQEYSNHSW